MTTRLKDPRAPRLSPRDRLARRLERSRDPDPLTPILLHTLERGLRGTNEGRQPASELDLAFARAARRHPALPRDLLLRLVDDYRALPAPVRERGVPQRLLGLSPATPLQARAMADIVFSPEMIASAGALTKFLMPAFLAPRILAIEPKAETYTAGQAVTIRGWNFAAQASGNTVTIWRAEPIIDAGYKKKVVATTTPAAASAHTLAVTLPASLGPYTNYAVEVASAGPRPVLPVRHSGDEERGG